MKNKLLIILVCAILSGCSSNHIENRAILDATKQCEQNGGLKWITNINYIPREKEWNYTIHCNNGFKKDVTLPKIEKT